MVAIPNADTGSAEDMMSIGMEALERLGATSPPRYLAPSQELARLARDAAEHLFSSLVPFAPKPLPLDRLLAGESFDAEQIWQQIDVQSRPLTRVLRRELSRFEKMEERQLAELFGVGNETAPDGVEEEEDEKGDGDKRAEEDQELDDEDEDEEEADEDDDENDTEDDLEEEDKMEPQESGVLNDGFFDTKELEKFMVEDEEREFEGKGKKTREEDDEEDDDIDQTDDVDDIDNLAANARYEDFFGKKKGVKQKGNTRRPKKSSKGLDEEDEWDMQDGSMDESEHSKEDDDMNKRQKNDNKADGTLSTFEKELKKNRSKIEQIEKELIAPPSWTMLGEVTASKRPKNSALEVDLEFQHNKAPPAISTEENSASIEELIIKRIRDGQFDDVQRQATLSTKVQKEPKQLDENKSQKGLAEIYEEEYTQKAGISNAPPSLTDEQKQQANALFKKLCLKLDALSHFHFTPKPVIEDMAIQSNVPALAMEEIAPLAVSDAAMLAPEEIFTGKGDIKEEAELTQTDRKRRRAKKKRKFKADSAKRASKKARPQTATPVAA